MRQRAKAQNEDEEEEEQVSCWELRWLSKYVQEPDRLIIFLWTFFAIMINTM